MCLEAGCHETLCTHGTARCWTRFAWRLLDSERRGGTRRSLASRYRSAVHLRIDEQQSLQSSWPGRDQRISRSFTGCRRPSNACGRNQLLGNDTLLVIRKSNISGRWWLVVFVATWSALHENRSVVARNPLAPAKRAVSNAATYLRVSCNSRRRVVRECLSAS